MARRGNFEGRPQRSSAEVRRSRGLDARRPACSDRMVDTPAPSTR
ncbi:MAG: hypothetical protein ACE10D_08765 [Planctomycetota bacterium]